MDRRKFLSIDIEIADDEDHLEFDTNDDIKNLLVNSGLWNAFRSRPFNRTPSIDSIALFICASIFLMCVTFVCYVLIITPQQPL